MTEQKKPIYVFILCPRYQGSTVLYRLVSSSPHASSLIGHGQATGEGQMLFSDQIEGYFANRFDPDFELDMKHVKAIFDQYWDHSKPILVEKSPPTICRAKRYEDYFSQFGEVYFILSIRNPYSTRDNINDWIRFAQFQRHNIEEAGLKNLLVLSYEEICEKKEQAIEKILNFLPELGVLSDRDESLEHFPGQRDKKITQEYLTRVVCPEKKTAELKQHQDLLEFFGYSLLSKT
jgi:hypothetical protein